MDTSFRPLGLSVRHPYDERGLLLSTAGVRHVSCRSRGSAGRRRPRAVRGRGSGGQPAAVHGHVRTARVRGAPRQGGRRRLRGGRARRFRDLPGRTRHHCRARVRRHRSRRAPPSRRAGGVAPVLGVLLRGVRELPPRQQRRGRPARAAARGRPPLRRGCRRAQPFAPLGRRSGADDLRSGLVEPVPDGAERVVDESVEVRSSAPRAPRGHCGREGGECDGRDQSHARLLRGVGPHPGH
jgi:hypothetical protein